MAKIQLISEFENLIKAMKTQRVLTPSGDFYRNATIRNYEVQKRNFIIYERFLGKKIFLHEINPQWCEDFHFYLLKKGYAKNTISAILSILKCFLRKMHAEGKAACNGAGIRSQTEITTAVFNTPGELRELSKMKFSEAKSRVRDIYVCQCFLGLCVADMFKFIRQGKILQKEIAEKIFFEIKTAKTGEVVVIPAAKIVLQTLEKQNFYFGKSFSEWYYRRTLKEIISKSKFERKILFHRTEGGAKIEREMMFSDLVGTHTARRSFATNAYLAGINPLDIMKITGHKSVNSFMRYIRCENTAVALKIADNDFFKTEL